MDDTSSFNFFFWLERFGVGTADDKFGWKGGKMIWGME